jgi:hypothetical protein
MPFSSGPGTVLCATKGIGFIVHGLVVVPTTELILALDHNPGHGDWRHVPFNVPRLLIRQATLVRITNDAGVVLRMKFRSGPCS